MKKLICWALAMTLALTCALPVGAVDDEEAEASPAPVTVTTAEELLEAIEAAEDGDAILIGDTITISESVTFGQKGKRLYLERSGGFSGIMFSGAAEAVTFESLIIEGGGTAASIIDSSSKVVSDNQLTLKNVWISNSGDSAVKVTNENLTIENCRFKGGRARVGTHILVSTSGKTQITGSAFQLGYSETIGGSIRNAVGTIVIDDCTFDQNNAQNSGGAIYTSGPLCSISNSVFTENRANTGNGGGICNSGMLVLTDTAIYDNIASGSGADIFSNDSLNVSFTNNDLASAYHGISRMPRGFYTDDMENRFDGETNVTTAVPLPIIEDGKNVALIFVFREDITAQEAESVSELETEAEELENQKGNIPAEEQEREPAKAEEDQEPASEPKQELEQETEATPEQERPSAPSTPPSAEAPAYTRGWSYVWPAEDSDTSEPAPAPAKQPEPETAAPALSCGGAALDTSGRAFLAGYGDGVIGEDDPVTRAQIAQIIYRLLTDESREALQTTENSFEDVPAEAWYNLAVSTIARAGIVIGCGDGFHPEGYITRAQLITIMARFAAPADQGSSYADVTGHWAESFIGTAEAAGWLTGGGDLHPNEYVSRREVVEFINHVFDLCEGAA